MAAIVFTCPVTTMKVQHWLDDETTAAGEHQYLSAKCQACTKLYLIKSKTGELLGEK